MAGLIHLDDVHIRMPFGPIYDRLRPMIHTLYNRTSYVQKDDDSVRVTLDENVRVFRESGRLSIYGLVKTKGFL